MQTDLVNLLALNLLFSVRIAPLVVVVATAIRTAMLLTGKKRAIVSWTRNSYLSFLTVLFAPGMVVNTAVRYAVSKLFRIDLDGIGTGSTYAELNLFLKVDRPPRVAVLITALYLSTIASVFIGFALMVIPMVLLLGTPFILLCWYISIAVLFNSSLRGGDAALLGAALKGSPRSGALELVAVMTILAVFYIQLGGVVL
ncbi:MAG: hypothetical protein ACFE7R_05945 [Candidatus Hodarchaeota archaeon]